MKLLTNLGLLLLFFGILLTGCSTDDETATAEETEEEQADQEQAAEEGQEEQAADEDQENQADQEQVEEEVQVDSEEEVDAEAGEAETDQQEEEKEELTGEALEQAKEEIKVVLNDNTKYAEEEELDNYVETLYVSDVESVKESVLQTFEKWDLDYEVEILEFIEVYEDEATIRAEQQNVAVGGEEPFNDNIAEVTHTFVKIDGEWKMYSSELIESTPLD